MKNWIKFTLIIGCIFLYTNSLLAIKYFNTKHHLISKVGTDFTFCLNDISVTFYSGGNAEMIRYGSNKQILKKVTGTWTAYGSENDMPGQTIKVTYSSNSSEEFSYILVRDGNGNPSVLVDGQGRRYSLCKTKSSLIGDNLKAQNFQSETDVLYYLDNKAFSNKSTGVTLSFSDMGSNMRINSRFLFQPEITVLSSYKAYCEYTVADDPSQKIRFVVNSSDNSIVEKGTGRAYFYEVSQNNFQQPQENTKKNNAVSIPKTVKYLTGDFTSLNDKLVGTYESKMNKGYILQITKVNSKKGSISLSYNGIKINASFRTTPWPMLNPDEKQKDFMFCNNETNVYIKGILGKNGTVTSLEVLVMGSNIKGHNGIVRFIRIK